MYKYKSSLLLVFIVSIVFLSSCNKHLTASKKEKQYYYTCPMHYNDIYYEPGKCPKCGMKLEAWDMENLPKNSSASSHSGHSGSGNHTSGCH